MHYARAEVRPSLATYASCRSSREAVLAGAGQHLLHRLQHQVWRRVLGKPDGGQLPGGLAAYQPRVVSESEWCAEPPSQRNRAPGWPARTTARYTAPGVSVSRLRQLAGSAESRRRLPSAAHRSSCHPLLLPLPLPLPPPPPPQPPLPPPLPPPPLPPPLPLLPGLDLGSACCTWESSQSRSTPAQQSAFATSRPPSP